MPISLFDLNPDIDIQKAAESFAANGRVQIKSLLTPGSADALHEVLARETPWGLGWQAGTDGPHHLDATALRSMTPQQREQISTRIMQAMQGDGYAFTYARYPMLDAYLANQEHDGPHDVVFEYLNAEPFLELIRHVTAIPSLIKADAQATLYAPNQFLPLHIDSHVGEGWRIAYVLSMCKEDWRPDWGGYLQFFDDEGDIVAGYKPRFNTLSLFAVPVAHAVSYVPPFAPIGRFSITGWFRDR